MVMPVTCSSLGSAHSLTAATKTDDGRLQAVEKMAKDFKARMTVRLAVAGAFHTHFMKPAEEKLRCGP